MAIPCPRCGREYDVTLFQFGRTIYCTCGARVGMEIRLGPPVSSSEPRFMVDAMLGGLARWLRVLGYDAAYDPHISDHELVKQALEEQRLILTRDRGLPREWAVSGCLVLKDDDPDAQLVTVVRRFDLDTRSRLFSRCTVCNHPLQPMAEGEAASRVPLAVAERETAFAYCPSCDQVYWEGSHTERMRTRLDEILG